MDIDKVLSEIGLNEGEIRVYLALLKLGSSKASELKNETQLHRTTIYDFIEKLTNHNLVSYVIKNNIKYYMPKDPEQLLDYLEEKQENLKKIIPKLKEISKYQKKDIRVEVYKGVEGLKTILNDIIKTKKELLGFGIEEIEFKKRLPIFIEQFFRKEEEYHIKERILISDKAKFIFTNKNTCYRFIPNKYFNPNPIFVYGNKVANVTWDPLTIIITEHSDLADSYKKYFELLWRDGKRKQ